MDPMSIKIVKRYYKDPYEPISKMECFAPIEIGRYTPKQQLTTNIPWQINMEPK